jgi:hypothetical protein
MTETALAINDIEAEVSRNERAFELAQRQAKAVLSSTLVPKDHQSIGNVMIAMNMAKRMNADVLMVLQNLHVIHGRPGWSSQFLIACFNSCGRYSSIRYRFSGTPGDTEYGCVAECTELATGEKIEGCKITMKMAADEGWLSKSGSKWKTMPEQMLRYRAAAFLIRTTAPEIGMGLMTSDEVEDVIDGTVVEGKSKAEAAADMVRSRKLIEAVEREMEGEVIQ